MNNHNLKILKQHYVNVKAGTKTFEIRKNDRAFQKGDGVVLQAYDAEEQKYFYQMLSLTEYNNWRPLVFKIGDVYPIDAERVVFSLLKTEESK